MTTGGVTSHSSEVGQREYVIFCVGQSIIKQQAFKTWAGSRDIGFKALHGMYKGRAERSFIVNSNNFDIVLVNDWCDSEESYLKLGACDARDRRPAWLEYMVDPMGTQYLGLFQSVGRREALSHSAWTFDPTTYTYYICKKEQEHVRRSRRRVRRPLLSSGEDHATVPVAA